MYICYDDILKRIQERPTWWLKGVPRYEKFVPDAVDVYANTVALIQTCCACGTEYYQAVKINNREVFENCVAVGDVGMGDPPNACAIIGANRECSSAPTTCRQIAVAEYWKRDLKGSVQVWRRDPNFELSLTDWFTDAEKWHHVDLTEADRAIVQTAFEVRGKAGAVAVLVGLSGVDLASARYQIDSMFWEPGFSLYGN